MILTHKMTKMNSEKLIPKHMKNKTFRGNMQTNKKVKYEEGNNLIMYHY